MAHIHRHTDTGGELVDISFFCSNSCHRDWCRENGHQFDGWDGCHELDTAETCQNCGEIMNPWPVVESDVPRGCLPVGHVTDRGRIEKVSNTAYLIGAEWVSFDVIHGRPNPVTPGVLFL